MFTAKKSVYLFSDATTISWLDSPILLSQAILYPAVFFAEKGHPGCGVLVFFIDGCYHPCFVGDEERTLEAWDKMSSKKLNKAFKNKTMNYTTTKSYVATQNGWFSFPKEILEQYRLFLVKKGITFETIQEMMRTNEYLPDLCRSTVVDGVVYYVFHGTNMQGGIFGNTVVESMNYSAWDETLLYTALLKD